MIDVWRGIHILATLLAVPVSRKRQGLEHQLQILFTIAHVYFPVTVITSTSFFKRHPVYLALIYPENGNTTDWLNWCRLPECICIGQ